MRNEGLGALVAIIVVASLGIGYLSGNNTRATETMTSISASTVTSTVTVSTSDVYEQVADTYAVHLTQLSARNMPTLVSEYESNATVQWTGSPYSGLAGLAGNYSGSGKISILLGSFVGKFTNFSLSNEYQSVGVKGKLPVVNSTFDFQAYSTILGRVNGTIVAQDEYDYTGNSWLIAHEVWNFTQFNEQYFIR